MLQPVDSAPALRLPKGFDLRGYRTVYFKSKHLSPSDDAGEAAPGIPLFFPKAPVEGETLHVAIAINGWNEYTRTAFSLYHNLINSNGEAISKWGIINHLNSSEEIRLIRRKPLFVQYFFH